MPWNSAEHEEEAVDLCALAAVDMATDNNGQALLIGGACSTCRGRASYPAPAVDFTAVMPERAARPVRMPGDPPGMGGLVRSECRETLRARRVV